MKPSLLLAAASTLFFSLPSQASLVAMYGFEDTNLIGKNQANPGYINATPYGDVKLEYARHPGLGLYSGVFGATGNAQPPRGLRLPDNSNILNGKSTLTVSTFFSASMLPDPNGVSNFIWIGRNGSEGEVRFGLQIFDVNKIRIIGRAIDGGSSGGATYNVGLTLNTLYHVAATLNLTTGTIQLYLNGVLVGSQSNTANLTGAAFPNTNSTKASIGTNGAGTGEFFYGMMDNLSIYDEVLSASAIANLAAAGGISVPEPSTTMLTILSPCLLFCIRRRSQ